MPKKKSRGLEKKPSKKKEKEQLPSKPEQRKPLQIN